MEIGTVDILAVGQHVDSRRLDQVKELIERDVCGAGGDAAVAIANGFGSYIKATILKSTGVAPAANAPTAAEGCRFDTQCKGDRICVQGQCTDPPAK